MRSLTAGGAADVGLVGEDGGDLGEAVAENERVDPDPACRRARFRSNVTCFDSIGDKAGATALI
jgi:hypothetical protein